MTGTRITERSAPLRAWNYLATALSCVAIVLATITFGAQPSAAQAPAGARVNLINQTSWVTAETPFILDLGLQNITDPAAFDVVVTVYGQLRNRTAFQQSLDDHLAGTPLILERRALTEVFNPGLSTAQVVLPVNDTTQRRYYLKDAGVYPVHVELQEAATDNAVAGFTTHLINSPPNTVTNKLNVATVFPLRAPTSADADDPFAMPNTEFPRSIATGIATAPQAPVALVPEGETIERLQDATKKAGASDTPDSLSALAAAAAGASSTILSNTWTPVPSPLYSSDYSEELQHQFDRGRNEVQTVFGNTENTTWTALVPIDSTAAANLTGRGYKRFIVREQDLAPLQRSTTLARPFNIAVGKSRTPTLAAQADAGLANHFDAPDPILGAHQLLADIAVIWNDLPAQTRGVVVMPPFDWQPSAAFLNIYMTALQASPVVKPVTLDQFFGLPTDGGTGRAALLRSLNPANKAASQGLSASHIKEARKKLNSFTTMVDPTNTTLDLLQRRLLYSTSAAFDGDGRTNQLNHFDSVLKDQLDAIRIPAERSIRLTARQGEIPVSIQNDTGYTVHVVVKLNSSKLEFPQSNARSIDVERQHVTERFSVDARTSGAFPVEVELLSPDGVLTVADSRVTVHSTATSSIGVGLTIGALAFLGLWWLRSVFKQRRHKGSSAEPVIAETPA